MSLANPWALRAGGALLLAAAAAAFAGDFSGWRSLIYAVGFSHYALALVYGRRQLCETARDPRGAAVLLALLAFGACLYWQRCSLLLYFGLHHALNEAYFPHARGGAPRAAAALRGPALALQLLLYAALLRQYPDLAFLDAFPGGAWTPLLPALALAAACWGRALFQLRGALAPRELAQRCAPEAFALGLLLCSAFTPILLLHVALYHFALWALWPLPALRAAGGRALGGYAAASAALVAVGFALSPSGIRSYTLDGSVFDEQFRLWSYLHISVSFALSTAQPAWITRGLRARAASAAPAGRGSAPDARRGSAPDARLPFAPR